jgi:hypothetical protein
MPWGGRVKRLAMGPLDVPAPLVSDVDRLLDVDAVVACGIPSSARAVPLNAASRARPGRRVVGSRQPALEPRRWRLP